MYVPNCRKLLMLALFGALLFEAAPSHALQTPRALATDSRIRSVRYSPNEVYQFIGHYGYQSAIEFESDESIQTISIGDSVAWMVNPAGNRLFMKPIDQNALTNMTVITNKRSYLFELHAEETQNIRDNEMVFVMRFTYPQSDQAQMDFTTFESFPDIEKEPEKYNFRYSIRGSSVIEPIRIFDDGQWTYFEFRDKNADIPAFFNVDSANNEELINFRKRGNYIVVERVSPRFTLRRGPDILCVYNETMKANPIPEPEKSFTDRVREGEIF